MELLEGGELFDRIITLGFRRDGNEIDEKEGCRSIGEQLGDACFFWKTTWEKKNQEEFSSMMLIAMFNIDIVYPLILNVG